MTQSKMTFGSDSFKKAAESLSGRATNTATVNSRMGLGDTSTSPTVNKTTNAATQNVSQSDRQSYANYNEGMANNPAFQVSVANNQRDFRENARQFDAGLNFKSAADQRANETDRFRSSTGLEGVKYSADAGVRSTGLQADAAKYGADKGYQASIYGADRGVDAARIGADANRFNALLGAGTAFFNSSQYRPTFNR